MGYNLKFVQKNSEPQKGKVAAQSLNIVRLERELKLSDSVMACSSHYKCCLKIANLGVKKRLMAFYVQSGEKQAQISVN